MWFLQTLHIAASLVPVLSGVCLAAGTVAKTSCRIGRLTGLDLLLDRAMLDRLKASYAFFLCWKSRTSYFPAWHTAAAPNACCSDTYQLLHILGRSPAVGSAAMMSRLRLYCDIALCITSSDQAFLCTIAKCYSMILQVLVSSWLGLRIRCYT